ncbi:NAD(P)-dependent oxidoreductase [Phenylobacterium sp. LjRoot225]|uniref:NAD(P)-dependent oxidoreductase n=1 Tax=Phenylobacterium sp. LjRoot225 TaxID=3342285 RepID=UPI003ECD85A0
MSITCGFIGLGDQGGPIARRMIDGGLPTVLWARRPESLDPYRDTPASFAATIAELGRKADHVGICVVDDDDVRQVCADLIPAMRPGARIAIHSTVHPDTCRSLEHDAAERGVFVIDAPVSGGSPAAKAGALTLMLGGEPDVIEAARPVFETFGRLIVRLGGVGAGQHAKLINNSLLAANIGLTDMALAAGAELGIAKDALVELLLASSGRSFGLEVRARMPAPTSFAHGAALLKKDVRLLGEVLGSEAPPFVALRDAADDFLSKALAGETAAAAT